MLGNLQSKGNYFLKSDIFRKNIAFWQPWWEGRTCPTKKPAMKTLSLARPDRRCFPQRWRPGMTLIEVTVVVLVMLSLLLMLFISGRAWKRGSDRALCIVNMETVQKGVRGFANMNGHFPGETVVGLETELIGLGRFMESAPQCPGKGTYTTLGDQLPTLGVLYMSCSLAIPEGHEPADFSGW